MGLREEGLALLKEAKKAKSTGFFKRSPDWDGAAVAYEAAMKKFRAAKCWKELEEAGAGAGEACEETSSWFLAASAWDSAALAACKLEKFPKAIEYYRSASNCFIANELYDKAAKSTERAALVFSKNLQDSKSALSLVMEAMDILQEGGKLGFSVDMVTAAVGACLEADDFDGAVDVMQRLADHYVRDTDASPEWSYKTFLSLLILHISNDDFIAAERCFQDHSADPGYHTSKHAAAGNSLLNFFQTHKEDAEELKKITSSSAVVYVIPPIARLARSLNPDSCSAPDVEAPQEIPSAKKTKADDDAAFADFDGAEDDVC